MPPLLQVPSFLILLMMPPLLEAPSFLIHLSLTVWIWLANIVRCCALAGGGGGNDIPEQEGVMYAAVGHGNTNDDGAFATPYAIARH